MCTGATWRSQWKLSFVRRRRVRSRRLTFCGAMRFLFSRPIVASPPPFHTTSFFRFLMPLTLPLFALPLCFCPSLSISFLFFRRPSGMGSLAAGAKCQSAGNTRTHLHSHTHSVNTNTSTETCACCCHLIHGRACKLLWQTNHVVAVPSSVQCSAMSSYQKPEGC